MRKNDWNFLVDAAALAALLLLLSTGILIRYVLPAGSGHFLALWGMDRHEWGTVHFWIAVVFLALMAIHLVLHWSWIACMIRWRPAEGAAPTARREPRVVAALLVLFLIALLALAPFFGRVDETERGGGRGREGHEISR
ncbi:MAG: DUF4405 domain-containing protein [Candidatus Eisenbacteria bacterium]|nr:DUF4405 domain-containing protein [Candidatus Eisenbacteria bacterium]